MDTAFGIKPHAHRKIIMLAFDECQSLDVVGPMESFGFANYWLNMTGRIHGPAYSLSVAAERPGPVRTMSGLHIMADAAIDEIGEDVDTLLVAGGLIDSAYKNPALLGFIERMAGRVRRLGSICTGTFLLAECGLLEGRRATTHWYFCERLAREYPNLKLEPDRLAVRDGHISTSGGVTAGMDLAMSLLEEDWGTEVAAMIGRWMLVFPNRPGGQSQFCTLLHKSAGARKDFRELQDWIMSHPSKNLSVEALAERMSMSVRHFARTFDREVGLTPAKFVEMARMERARLLLEQSSLSVDAIAEQCGFGFAENMRRAFQRSFKISPQEYRARFRSPNQHSANASSMKIPRRVAA